jgi:osmotically inducible protein OsmC
MTVESSASATWEGDLLHGKGTVTPASGSFPEQSLTWNNRASSRASGTSPEELIAAAHSGCFSMALANGLAGAGHAPEDLRHSSRRQGKGSGHRCRGLHCRSRGRQGELSGLEGPRGGADHRRGDPGALAQTLSIP